MAWIESRKRKHHTAYRVYWREPGGRVKVRTFKTLTEARRWARDVEHRKDTGAYVDPDAGKVPLGEYVETVLARAAIRPTTRAWYEAHAKHVPQELRETAINAVGRGDVRDLLAELSKTKGTATVDAVRQLLRRVFAEAVSDDLVGRNPVAGVRTPKPRQRPPRFLSADEVAALAEAVEPRYRALVLLLAYGGLRIGEALALRIEDVNTLKATVTVRASVSEVVGRQVRGATKTGRVRTVHLPRFVAEALGEQIDEGSPKSAPAFTTAGGKQVRATNFRRREFCDAVEAAELAPPPTLHDLRQTAAALAIQAGAHPKEIADMLGHSTVRVTIDTYGHLFPGLHERLAEQLDEVGRKAKPPKAEVRELR